MKNKRKNSVDDTIQVSDSDTKMKQFNPFKIISKMILFFIFTLYSNSINFKEWEIL